MRSAHAQPNSGYEADDVIARRRRTHLLDAIEVDDRAPMDARESRRIELLIQPTQRLTKHRTARCRVEACVIPACLDPLDVAQSNNFYAAG